MMPGHSTKQPRFKQGLLPAASFKERADVMKEGWGTTDLYSTGDTALDTYLGGGFGRRGNGYEIVLLTGAPGIGKSTIGLNMMLDPIRKGTNVGLMILEDDPADVLNRLRMMTNGEIDKATNVFFCDDQSEGYTLEQALQAVENWFKVCDVVLLDHLEYLWAGAIGQTEYDKWTQQEIWMRRVNSLMKGNGKTLVLIQHVNKSGENGFSGVKGSSSLAQTATKFMEYYISKDGSHMLRLWKTRFTPYRNESHQLVIDKFKIRSI